VRSLNYQILATITAMEEVLAYAATKLGYESLKMELKEAIKAFFEGNDVFVSLPTGFEKSLCFALLPYVLDYLRGDTESPKSIDSATIPAIQVSVQVKSDHEYCYMYVHVGALYSHRHHVVYHVINSISVTQ